MGGGQILPQVVKNRDDAVGQIQRVEYTNNRKHKIINKSGVVRAKTVSRGSINQNRVEQGGRFGVQGKPPSRVRMTKEIVCDMFLETWEGSQDILESEGGKREGKNQKEE